MSQTAADLIRIQQEVMSGLEWGDPRSKVAQTDENRQAWEECARDVAAMTAKGTVIDLPHEL